VRAAWLHMAGDAASSAAIILGALLIRYTGWLAIDPILSILIGIAIVWSGWGIIRESPQYPFRGFAERVGTEECPPLN